MLRSVMVPAIRRARGHVERGIGHIHVGRNTHAADVGYFLGGAFFDQGSRHRSRNRKVERRDGRGHIEGAPFLAPRTAIW